MKKLLSIIFIMHLLLVNISTPALAQYQDSGLQRFELKSRFGFGDNQQKKEMKKIRSLEKELKLTKEQKARYRELSYSLKQQMKPYVVKIQEQRQKIAEMLQLEAEEEDINSEKVKFKNIVTKAMLVKKANMDEFEMILNPWQKEKFKKIRLKAQSRKSRQQK